MHPNQISELFNEWYCYRQTFDFQEFLRYPRAVFYENGKLTGIKFSNLAPALTKKEIKDFLSYFSDGLKYLGIYGTIDCKLFQEVKLPDITHLFLGSVTVKYLDCLKFFPKLKFLELTAENLRTINGIEQASSLESVVLSAGYWRSFAPLKKLRRLKSLFLDIYYSDPKFLKNLPIVEEMFLTNEIACKIPLEKLQNIKKLHYEVSFYDTDFKREIKFLSGLENIVSLNVSGLNKISASRIFELANRFKKLEVLEIEGEYSSSSMEPKPDNIEAIVGLKNLRHLVLYNIFPDDLSPIGELSGLQTLKIEFTSGFKTGANSEENGKQSLDFIQKLKKLKKLTLNAVSKELDNLNFLKGLKNLQKISLENLKINDFSGIRYAENLKNLYLYNIETRSLDGLENLKNIETIEFQFSKIEDFNALGHLKSLKNLFFTNTENLNFNFIPDLRNLENLDISNSLFFDFGLLKELKNLSWFGYEQNEGNYKVKNVQTLALLPKLKFLSLSSNGRAFYEDLRLDKLNSLNGLSIDRIPDLKQLTKLSALRELHLHQTLGDLSFLEFLPDLVALSIKIQKETDLSPLLKLKNLVKLEIDGTNVVKLSVLLKHSELQSIFAGNLKGRSKNRSLLRKLQNHFPVLDYYVSANKLLKILEKNR